MSALQRAYPFEETERMEYDGAVPEPVDSDETRASGLSMHELAQVELVAVLVRRAVEKYAGSPSKLAAVKALLRSAVGE